MTHVRWTLAAVVALSVFAATQSVNWNSSGQARAAEKEASKLAKDLIGTWALAGAPGDEKEPPTKGGRFKFITNKSWTITEADPDTGVVIFHHGGTFTLDGDKYTESIVYANESTKDMIGATLHFKIKVEGDTLTQEGIDNSFNEVWKCVK
jgi:glucose dehydrogenase